MKITLCVVFTLLLGIVVLFFMGMREANSIARFGIPLNASGGTDSGNFSLTTAPGIYAFSLLVPETNDANLEGPIPFYISWAIRIDGDLVSEGESKEALTYEDLQVSAFGFEDLLEHYPSSFDEATSRTAALQEEGGFGRAVVKWPWDALIHSGSNGTLVLLKPLLVIETEESIVEVEYTFKFDASPEVLSPDYQLRIDTYRE